MIDFGLKSYYVELVVGPETITDRLISSPGPYCERATNM